MTVDSGRPAVMFQEPALLPWLDAGRNVELPLRLSGVGRAARRARAAELLDLVRLGGQARKRPHELSGGMRQRVALARALAATVERQTGGDGGLLLMDEPFAALDAITRDFLQGELQRIWQATGSAVLFVTHDVREAVRLGQRVVLLSSRPGTVVREWDLDDDGRPRGAHRGDHRPAAGGDLDACPRLRSLSGAGGAADTAAVGAGLDALDTPTVARTPLLPPGAGHRAAAAGRARRCSSRVWQAVWASAIYPEYQLPAPLAVWHEFAEHGRRRQHLGDHLDLGAPRGARVRSPRW